MIQREVRITNRLGLHARAVREQGKGAIYVASEILAKRPA